MIKKTLLVVFALLVTITTTQAEVNFDFKIIPTKQVGEFGSNIHDFMQVRRGGGGRSFGGSRSRSSSRSKSSSSTRSRSSSSTKKSSTPGKTPSFGGTRMSKQQATSKYGTPRKTQTVQAKNQNGEMMNYRMNSYGGFSSGLMTGYMMGNMSWWMWAPAMMYSRPVYATNDDGSVDVYPPTFQFGRLLFWLLIIGVAIFLFRSMRKNKAARQEYSSFS